MRDESVFKVAGLSFSVLLPDGWDVETLLPSFRPFQCEVCPGGERIFRLLVTTQPFADDGRRTELLSESSNDMGHVRLMRGADGYRMEMDYGAAGGNAVHILTVNCLFEEATAYLCPEDPFLKTALSSMLRILYAQAVLLRDGVSIHASCVCLEGRSYLFLGKSGTGKSTHARQWLEAFPGCSLLNDDNPVLRIEADGTLRAYGTPWSGKTPCYKNESYPVAGIARIQRAKENRFVPLEGPDSFVALLPSCSAIRQDVRLQDALHDTLIQMSELVVIGRMECLPNPAAARECERGIGDK